VTTALGEKLVYLPGFRWLRGPGWVSEILVHKGLDGQSYADALFTSIGASIAYDAYLRDAKKSGLADPEAAALEKTEDMVYRTAQPIGTGQKANWELNRPGLSRVIGLFASDARKNTALFSQLALSQQPDSRNVSKALLLWPLIGAMAQGIRAAYTDWRDDDDDEILDAEHWAARDFLIAGIMGPIAGIPFVGDFVQKATKGMSARGLLDGHAQALSVLYDRITEDKREDEPVETTVEDIATVAKSMDARTAVAARTLELIFQSADNLVDDPEEKGLKAQKRRSKEEKEAREAALKAMPPAEREAMEEAKKEARKAKLRAAHPSRG
jgi:hypothetical protein